MLTFTTDQWVIIGLVFVLGALIGMWLTSGGRRKWKTRYNEEIEKRRVAERNLSERETHWATREKEWRDQDSRREAALRDRGDYPARPRDIDGDGVPNRADTHPADDRRG